MPRRGRTTKEVSGTPLVEITVSAGISIANWANLHRKCNARGPMDKASAYGAEDSRFDPWRACKLPKAASNTGGSPVNDRHPFGTPPIALVADVPVGRRMLAAAAFTSGHSTVHAFASRPSASGIAFCRHSCARIHNCHSRGCPWHS